MFAVVAVAALSSCNNEGTDPVLEEDASIVAVAASVIDTTAFGDANMAAWSEIADTDLPQEVLNYIADNYPDNTIHHAWVDDNGGYVVLLNNKTALRFDNTGAFVEAIENRQGLKIACLEEIALNNKWIGKKDIIQSIKFYGKCKYSNYLMNLL